MSRFNSTPLGGGGLAGSHSVIFFSQDLPELDESFQEKYKWLHTSSSEILV